jgi:hypothetical protein
VAAAEGVPTGTAFTAGPGFGSAVQGCRELDRSSGFADSFRAGEQPGVGRSL